MELSVGQRVKELRLRVGVSQRELARRSGQSPGAISAIEADKVSPSVETLSRLVTCLGVTLAEFFSIGPADGPSAFYGPEDMLDISLGRIHYRQLGRSIRQTHLQLVRATVEPGSDTGTVGNPPDTDEVGYILSGRVHVTIGSESRVLAAGDGYMARGGQMQRFRNIFEERCEYIYVTSPPRSEPSRG